MRGREDGWLEGVGVQRLASGQDSGETGLGGLPRSLHDAVFGEVYQEAEEFRDEVTPGYTRLVTLQNGAEDGPSMVK